MAELVERALFDEGWQVELAGSGGFSRERTSDRRQGVPHGGDRRDFLFAGKRSWHMQSVRAIFSAEAFFALEEEIERDERAAAKIVERLHRWREQRAYSSGD